MRWNNTIIHKEEPNRQKNGHYQNKQTIKELKAHASVLTLNLSLLNDKCQDA